MVLFEGLWCQRISTIHGDIRSRQPALFVGLCQFLLSMFALIWCTVKKIVIFFVWCIACLGNLVQSNILAKMCLKKPPFASKAQNMVSPKVVLCSQFNQRRQWFSTFWLNGWFDCSLITGNVISEFCKTSLGCPINNCYIVIKFNLKKPLKHAFKIAAEVSISLSSSK